MTYSPEQSNSYQNFYCQFQDSSYQKYEGNENAFKIHPTVQDNKQTKKIQSRSKKKIGKVDYQISFQRNILDSHIQAFNIFFEQYIEKIKIHSKNDSFNFNLKTDCVADNFDYCKWIAQKIEESNGLNAQQKLQLLEDWLKEQHLVKFLKIISDKFDYSLSAQFFYLTTLIWQKYLHAQNVNYNSRQDNEKLIKLFLVQDFEKIYQSPYLLQISFRQLSTGQNKKQFLSFVQLFAETIYLIIEGYFFNPYSGNMKNEMLRGEQVINNFNWECSDEENIMEPTVPRKMMKPN